MYKVVFDRSVFKQLKKLPIDIYGRVFNAIIELSIDPTKAQAINLTGKDGYRIRIGTYRVLYTIDHTKKTIFITTIGHRRDVYQ